jgi:ABC-type lipoprotein export system ATPase subunit
MKLKKMKFVEYAGKSNEWNAEKCTLENINLIVGKNASGKSRILNSINSLANVLSRQNKLDYPSGDYEVFFDKNGKEIQYLLKFEENRVIKERLIIDNVLMERNSDGTGKIYSNEFKKNMKFQAQVDEVAAFSKLDSIQHPFLNDLFNWGDSLIHFHFGKTLGQETLVSFIKAEKREKQIDLKDTNQVIGIFKKGLDSYSDKYVSAIKDDMAEIGYDINEIDIGSPKSIRVIAPFPSPLMSIRVKEADLNEFVDQHGMSQGMFRALSLIIQLNYASFAQQPSCVLIDDIGEGLDYERSTSLIKLIIKKAENTPTQLIMATNDRFVMNNVPLQYWTIIHRIRNRAICLNNRNSPKLFADFEMTGLNNFDLFSSNYFLKYLGELQKDLNDKDRTVH